MQPVNRTMSIDIHCQLCVAKNSTQVPEDDGMRAPHGGAFFPCPIPRGPPARGVKGTSTWLASRSPSSVSAIASVNWSGASSVHPSWNSTEALDRLKENGFPRAAVNLPVEGSRLVDIVILQDTDDAGILQDPDAPAEEPLFFPRPEAPLGLESEQFFSRAGQSWLRSRVREEFGWHYKYTGVRLPCGGRSRLLVIRG